jgi:hypothetical protein
MHPRLALVSFKDSTELQERVIEELTRLCARPPEFWSPRHLSLLACCNHAAALGAKAAVIQRRVQDNDFLAEFNAYYSRQFAHVGQHCVRIHFFREPAPRRISVLKYLDRRKVPGSYLGFITLRPVSQTPVGGSIISGKSAPEFVRCADEFPVHLAGVELSVRGTPFMQQDNAVGACAQAAIWMALRTVRKREGTRAHDPAQITDAATRFSVTSRILPNRAGLTLLQMIEAVRSAGYSPHPITFGDANFSFGSKLTAVQLARAARVLHAYVESAIPTLLVLYPVSGGHAVVVIGHSFSADATQINEISLSLSRGVAIKVIHAVSWVPNFIIHNDNSGPYLLLDRDTAGGNYALDQTFAAIPLLPADVFLTGEEALSFALNLWASVIETTTEQMSFEDTAAFSEQFVIRLLLLEKSKIRCWAARSDISPEVRRHLRLQDLPRRVWVLELHLRDRYSDHGQKNAPSLVGFILLDSTGDDARSAMLMIFLNLPAFTPHQNGSLIVANPVKWAAVQTTKCDPVQPFRDLD